MTLRALVVLAVLLGWVEPALAHSSKEMGELYGGMLQPVLHFESLLPVLALALFSVQQGEPLLWQLPVAFAGSALLAAGVGLTGVVVPGATHVQTVSMLALGLLVAAKQRLVPPVALALAALAGLAQGYHGTFGEEAATQSPVLYITGFELGLGLLLFHVENLAFRARAFWMQIGMRVVGSWIAAVGLLIGVLALRPA